MPLQVTGLEFDAVYDCKRVVAPVGEAAAGDPAPAGPGGACAWEAAVAPGVLAALDDAGVRIAAGLGLNGLMDVEVMVSGARAQGARDRRPPAQPDAHGGLLVERPQHVGAAGGDGAQRAPPVVDRTAGPRLRLPARARRARYAGGPRRARDGERRRRCGWCPASSARTRRSRTTSRGRAEWAATLSWRPDSAREARPAPPPWSPKLARCEGLRVAPEDELACVSEGDPR